MPKNPNIPIKVVSKQAAAEQAKLSPKIHNRRAHFDYHILDKIEAGIELMGSEVKSLRKGHCQLAQSFARVRNGQVLVEGMHIDEYVEANRLNHDPTRTRKLLLHKREIRRLELKINKEGHGGKGGGATLIPLEIYWKRGYAKMLLGVAVGKKQYDKRAAIKEREDKRNIAKEMKRG